MTRLEVCSEKIKFEVSIPIIQKSEGYAGIVAEIRNGDGSLNPGRKRAAAEATRSRQ